MSFNKKSYLKIKFILFCSALFYACLSIAGYYHSNAELQKITKQFIAQHAHLEAGESLEVVIHSADVPLRLPICTKSIEAAYPPESNHELVTAIQLSCEGEKPWHTLIPVNIKIMSPVIVAKNAIQANAVISEDEIDFEKYDKQHLYNGYYKDKNEVLGNVAPHLITAGTVLTKQNIQRPLLVYRNQSIDIMASNNSVTVVMKGIAKSDGSLNDSVKVYNPSSKKILDAVVIGANKVEVVL